MVVSRKDREDIYYKTYGSPMTIIVDDFLYPKSQVILEIANDGIGSINYVIEKEDKYDWLEISSLKGSVEFQEEIVLSCKKEELAKYAGETQTARFFIKDGETTVAVQVMAKYIDVNALPSFTFLEQSGIIAIEANHFCAKKDVAAGSFVELKNYGRSGTGMKVYPTTVNFEEKEEKPSLTYRFLIEEIGDKIIEIWTTPVNSVQHNPSLRFELTDPCGNIQTITAISSDFRAGDPYDETWSKGVLDQIRICKIKINLKKGVQEISIGALEAGLVLERILIYSKNTQPLQSYLGPPESFYSN
jgi:hypothetical protein